MHTPYKIHTLALVIAAVFSQAAQAQTAEEPPTESVGSARLENIKVTGRRNAPASTERSTADDIQREMIRDNRDLVRYSADVGVAENGRHQKGFAMRGVDDNRVGISIDGVSLPDSEENSLYKRYGNFNNSRLRIDPELVRSIDVIKGSDSINFGSGSLGGNVNYRTLNAGDIVQGDRNFGGLLRSGYSSKNREWTNTLGFGFQNESFDAALLYSQRRGHETKSRGGDIKPWEGDTDQEREKLAQHGMHRIHPDPAKHKNHSYLAKFGWQIAPAHRLSLSHSGQNNSNWVSELSYEHPTWLTGRGWRDVNDRQRLNNTNLSYEFIPETTALSTLKVDLDHQRTQNGTRIYRGEYNYISTGLYGTDRQHLAEYFQRNNKTDFKRLSLYTEFKPFRLGGEHTVSFKLFGSKRKFENINNDRFLDADGSLSNRYGLPNPDIYTIQHPIRTNAYGFALQDKIKWNDIFSTTVGLRYDYEKFNPHSSNLPCGNATRMGRLCAEADANTFKNWSGSLALDAQLNDAWKVGYQISSGFRNPTASEMYFSFESFSGNWFANPNLKAERSINHNLSLQGSGRYGELDVNLYHSRYRKFLYEREGWVNIRNPYCQPGWGCNLYESVPYQQFHNADSAKISGIEIKGSLNLNAVSPLPPGLRLSGAIGYSKGSMSSEGRKVNLLAIQPLKAVIGLDYEQPEQKWGIFSRLTYNHGKNPKDAQYLKGQRRCVRSEFDPWFGFPICREWGSAPPTVEQFPWQNKSAWVLDVYGYYKPVKNLTLRAGVYNLFNRKYHSWDTLRGINLTGTSDRVASLRNSNNHNQGLQRFYAPGRNFAVSLEYKF